MAKTVPNSAKYRPIARYSYRPLQHSIELHQKDLRIMTLFLHILGPGNEGISEADTFLALSLIVPLSVYRDPYTARRVDIPYPRPCGKVINSQFIDLWTFSG